MNTVWTPFDFTTEADVNSRNVAALLEGVEFRCANGSTGKIRAGRAGLELSYFDGRSEPLKASHGASVEFAISEGKLKSLGTVAAVDAQPRTIEQILASCPEWSRRIVAKHLAPEKLAAHDAAVKDARIAQLSQLGHVVSGRTDAPATSQGKFATAPPAPTAREAREAQLRDIGKLVSGRR